MNTEKMFWAIEAVKLIELRNELRLHAKQLDEPRRQIAEAFITNLENVIVVNKLPVRLVPEAEWDK